MAGEGVCARLGVRVRTFAGLASLVRRLHPV